MVSNWYSDSANPKNARHVYIICLRGVESRGRAMFVDRYRERVELFRIIRYTFCVDSGVRDVWMEIQKCTQTIIYVYTPLHLDMEIISRL